MIWLMLMLGGATFTAVEWTLGSFWLLVAWLAWLLVSVFVLAVARSPLTRRRRDEWRDA